MCELWKELAFQIVFSQSFDVPTGSDSHFTLVSIIIYMYFWLKACDTPYKIVL